MEKRVLFSPQWYEMRVHQGILRYAQEQHWDIFSSHHMPEHIADAPAVDGLIVEVGLRDRRRLALAHQHIGSVVALEDFGDQLDVPRIHADNHAIGRLAAQHFIERGFTRFVTVCRANHKYIRDRIEGFHRAISRVTEVRCDDIQLPKRRPTSPRAGGKDPTPVIDSVLGLKRPVGIFCVDDDDAMEVIRRLKRKGLAIPEEAAVVSVNNDPLICPYALVPITSVDPNFEEIGYKAAQLLGRLMRGEKVEAKPYCIKPKGIVIRRSSDIRAVDDVQVAKAIRFIWDHADQWRSMKEVSAHIDLATRTLQWRFKKAMGYSLQDEIIRSRINRIQDLLIQTDKPVRRIAEEMGFSSVQYLIRLYSKETGLSPLKYRHLHRAQHHR